MKLLKRMFSHLATKESHEWAMTLGIMTYRVRKLEDGGGFIALGVEDDDSHPEFQMAHLVIWPKFTETIHYCGPQLSFYMLRNPGTETCSPSMSANFHGKMGNSFTSLCVETMKYANLLSGTISE